MNSSKLLRVGMPVVGLCVFAVMQSGCQSEVLADRPSVPPAERDFVDSFDSSKQLDEIEIKNEKNTAAVTKSTKKQSAYSPDFKYPRFQDTDHTPIYSAPRSKGATVSAGSVYIVRRGDSLSKIAARHRVKTSALAAANNLKFNSVIRVGQKLVIPGSKGIAAAAPAKKQVKVNAAETRSGFYTVRRGDSISRIAKRCKVKQAELMAVNNLTPQSVLRIGQTLKLPGATLVNDDAAVVEKNPAVEKNVDKTVENTAPANSSSLEDDVAKEIDGAAADSNAAETAPKADTAPAAAVSDSSPVVINQDIHVDDFCKQHNVSKADVIRLNSSVTENSVIKKNEVILLP